MKRSWIGNVVLAAVVAAVVSFVMVSRTKPPQRVEAAPEKFDNVYQRVLRTGVIRCAYVAYPPGFMKDANTGKVSGIFVDVLDRAARELGLRIEWTEEVGWGSMIEGLQGDRYDMVGSPVWANSSRAKLADFGPPIYFSAIGVYVRSGDQRFQGDKLAELNAPAVKIAAIDGEMSSIIAASQFPKAKVVSLPQLSDDSQLLLNVTTGHADITFVEPYIAALYMKNNPGSVQDLVPDRPLRFFPTTIMFRKNQPSFKSMLDVAIDEQLNAGILDELFARYSVPRGSLLMPALPYRLQASTIH
jgi:polar amino acid transport system substrate-binding protein